MGSLEWGVLSGESRFGGEFGENRLFAVGDAKRLGWLCETLDRFQDTGMHVNLLIESGDLEYLPVGGVIGGHF